MDQGVANQVVAVSGLHTVASISISGLIATSIMSLFVFSFSRTLLLPINPFVAVGTMVTAARSEALKAGVLLHISAGLVASFLYAFILKAIGMVTSFMPLVGAGMIGLVHSFVLSFLIVIVLGENGQTPGVRMQGMAQAGVYLVAHIIFGISLGILFMMMPSALV